MQWWQRCISELQLPLFYAFLIALCSVLAVPAEPRLGLFASVLHAASAASFPVSHASAAEWCSRAGTRTLRSLTLDARGRRSRERDGPRNLALAEHGRSYRVRDDEWNPGSVPLCEADLDQPTRFHPSCRARGC